MKDTELRMALDKAIDEGDMDEVERLLESTPDVPNMPENFAYSIIKENKENKAMKRFKIGKAGIIAAAVILSCAAVSGTVLVKHYSAAFGNKYIQVAGNGDIDKEELENIAKTEITDKDIKNGNVIVADTVNYDTIKDAEKELGIRAALPKIMPELEISEISGCILNDNRRDMYIVYGNKGKCFGITIGYEKLNEGETSVTSGDIDPGTLDSYTSEKGYKFDTLSETGESGTANIYTTHIGDYEYSLVFENFSEKEMKNIVDSVDLEGYR